MLEKIEHDNGNNGKILELRFARPPVNALDPAFISEILAAVQAAPSEGARALILSGQPGMFSAGLDVPALLPLDEKAMLAFWKDFSGLMAALARSPIPVVAALTGHSPAGGAVLALFCDTRIMAEGEFKIGLNEVQVGLPLPPVILRGLQRQVGNRAAEQLAVPGKMVDPQTALELGLVDEVVPTDQVVDAALEWCRSRLSLPPVAMQKTREFARSDLAALFDDMSAEDDQRFLEAWFSDETRSTMKALVESLKNRKKG